MSGCCCRMFRKKKTRQSDEDKRRTNQPTSETLSPESVALVRNASNRQSRTERGLDNPASTSAAMVNEEHLRQHAIRSPLEHAADYYVRFVGILEKAQGLQHFQENHLDLMKALDHAQAKGKFRQAEKERDVVILNLSKCGVKVIEIEPDNSRLVRWRHGLVEVVRLIHYEDRSGSSLVAIKLGKEGEDIYDCMVFQCEHKNQATDICSFLETMFMAVCQSEILTG
ncbi:integrin beta-1-binding protein 1-like [Amphiura filiformis]|uniref:integrin beta-1-binding protein 1-like n=1 Tax=Amphiura filiformis TaxID=82378 RepID=UPI003B21A842